jgi:hypothetical protein
MEAEVRLTRAAQMLLKPTAEACEAAVTELESAEHLVRAALAGPPAALPGPDQVRRLQAALRGVIGLWENAAGFRLGWARVLGAMTGGYTERGEPKLLEPPATIAIEG